MRKRLAVKTVAKAFEKIGFVKNSHLREDGPYYFDGNGLVCRRIYAKIDGTGNIECREARWSKRSNVHIVSYWGWPSTLKDLDKIINGVVETYSELCGCKFNT